MTPVETFLQELTTAGLTPPVRLQPGKVTRFPGIGKPTGNKAGWAWLSEDGLGGAYGDWASGLSETWHVQHDHVMTVTERAAHVRRGAALQRIRQKETATAHAQAAKQAQAIWNQACPAPVSHPYLQHKHVQAHGIRLGEHNQLLVPVLIDGHLSSVQRIDGAGAKVFFPGGKVSGGSHVLGNLSGATILLIAEGYATGASLYEAIGLPVVVAFSAGNVRSVAEHVRRQYPEARILVCGDHDLSGTGQRAAREAADAVGGLVTIPEEAGHDFNDVMRAHGLDALKATIAAVLEPAPTSQTLATAEQGPDPIEGETDPVLDDVYRFLGKFVAYPSKHAQVAHCLWVAHTHLMEQWESTPRIAFLSPEPGSGKTRALELTETLVPRPVEAINVTSAYFFRKISDPQGLPTILHDEIDTIFGPRAKEHEEVRGVINAGHRRGASAGRCVMRGREITLEEFPAFCAVALAGLGNLPDTILSRSVSINMRRRAPGEVVQPYRRRIHAPEGHRLRDRLVAWATGIRPTLNTDPAMPDGIEDRNADVWEALLSVADAIGGDWPDRARVAAVALVAANRGNQPSLGVRLLTDLRAFFLKNQSDAAWTVDILAALHNLEEAPWADLRGKPLDARKLATLLHPYGVKAKQVKIGTANQRGYTRVDLGDAWTRYLPPMEEEPCPSPGIAATSATNATDNVFVEVDV